MSLSIKIGNGNQYINPNEFNDGKVTFKVYFNDINVKDGNSLYIRTDNKFDQIKISQNDIDRGYIETNINVACSVNNNEFILSAQVNESPKEISKFIVLDPVKSTDDTINIEEDATAVLSMKDFGSFGDNLPTVTEVEVRIDSLPNNGVLLFDGQAISAGSTFSSDDIQSGKLVFKSTTNSDGDSSFNFSISEDGAWGEDSYTTDIEIAAIADKPTLSLENNSDITPPQKGEGLSLSVYDHVYCDVDSCDFVANSNLLKSLANNLNNETKVITDFKTVGDTDVQCSTIQAVKGLVYLEAGSKVSFNGYADDSYLLRLGGKTLVYTTGNAYGDFDTQKDEITSGNNKEGDFHSKGIYEVTTSGYYTFESYVFNSSGPGSYNIQMSVDGGNSYKDLNTQNFDIYPSIEALDATGKAQHSAFILGDRAVGSDGTDGGYYTTDANVGVAGNEIKLPKIDADLTDKDGSEKLTVQIKDIPAGAVISDGTQQYSAVQSKTLDVTNWDLANLTIKVANSGSYNLKVIATSTEEAVGKDVSVKNARTISNIALTVNEAGTTPLDESDYVPKGCGVWRDLHGNIVVESGNPDDKDGNDFIVVGDDVGSGHDFDPIISTELGNDVVHVKGVVDCDGQIYTGAGDDQLNAAAIIGKSHVDMGNGDDIVKVGGSISGYASVDLNSGNDTIDIQGCINCHSTLNTGAGNDKVEVGNSISDYASVNLNSGNDTLTVKGVINCHATVDMGEGDDSLNINSFYSISGDAKVNGGSGFDTINLENPSACEDLTRIAHHADNIEAINLSDNPNNHTCTKLTITVDDILDLTDSNNTLQIKGDLGDKVIAEKNWSWDTWSYESKDTWTHQGSSNGFDHYVGTNSHGQIVKLDIEQDLHIDL